MDSNFKKTNFKFYIYPVLVVVVFNTFFVLIIYLFGNICNINIFGYLDFSGEGVINQILKLNEKISLDVNDISLPENMFSIFVIIILFGAISGAIINFPFALGEEIGWSGYLYNSIKTNFVLKSLLIGLIWGIWHIPVIIKGYNFGQSPFIGSLLMICFCIISSFTFNLLRYNSNSVIPATILHGSLNATVPALVLFIHNGNELLVRPAGVIGSVVFMLIFLILNHKLNIINFKRIFRPI